MENEISPISLGVPYTLQLESDDPNNPLTVENTMVSIFIPSQNCSYIPSEVKLSNTDPGVLVATWSAEETNKMVPGINPTLEVYYVEGEHIKDILLRYVSFTRTQKVSVSKGVTKG